LNRNTIDMKLLREVSDALHRIDHDTTESASSVTSRSRSSGWSGALGPLLLTCQERIAAASPRARSSTSISKPIDKAAAMMPA